MLAGFAVAAYVVTRILGQSGWKGIFLWFVVCLVGHDLIGWPVYALADRTLTRFQARDQTRRPRVVPWINHVRAPTVVSAVLLGMFSPLIFRLENARYEGITGFSENVYLTNWLVVTGILFAGSAAIYVLRLGLARKRPPANEPGHGRDLAAPGNRARTRIE
jgi:hypothetical protein